MDSALTRIKMWPWWCWDNPVVAPQGSISSMFSVQLLHQQSYASRVQTYNVSIKKLRSKLTYVKAAGRTLVKLTPDVVNLDDNMPPRSLRNMFIVWDEFSFSVSVWNILPPASTPSICSCLRWILESPGWPFPEETWRGWPLRLLMLQ